jgi:hypothetical protein
VSRARDRLRGEQRLTARTTVATALRTTLPALSDADVSKMLAIAKANKGIPLNELAAHLATHPDALTSGDPRCPRAVVRLAHTLRRRHAIVVRPAAPDAARPATCRGRARRVGSARCALPEPTWPPALDAAAKTPASPPAVPKAASATAATAVTPKLSTSVVTVVAGGCR